jgi:hypothetical protein
MWEIITYEGVGPIKFGMTRNQVRAILGKPTASFMKGGEAPTDAYDRHYVHVFYDLNDTVEYVEVFDASTIQWKGKVLRGLSCMQWYDLLTGDGSHVSFEGDTLTSHVFGLSVWVPLGDNEEEREVRSIGAFRRGYWEEKEEEQ